METVDVELKRLAKNSRLFPLKYSHFLFHPDKITRQIEHNKNKNCYIKILSNDKIKAVGKSRKVFTLINFNYQWLMGRLIKQQHFSYIPSR